MSDKPYISTRNAVVGQSLIFTGKFFKPGTPEVEAAPPSADVVNGELFTINKCSPVAVTSPGTVKLADNASTALSDVLGLMADDCDSTMPAPAQTSGEFEASTAAWDAVTGQSGGLTPTATYFLGAGGTLTTTPPTSPGSSLVRVGVALSATRLELGIARPILL